ncbi:Ser/Thr protein kinase RdoA involved in Cpx stress response, MazF antagonist [Desulforhopalus singaporensis]|uniref:Stress response kinase A n=2 Tax=Desulforhopalus singaporensis TaxID=91360 RepID=A0A1H0UH51_9BACT|nr:Ser/Thr protein kinase RdoA involved in Cpx stress response, MazF antagonist [Desulforhopalus singaporensis]
MDISSKTGQGDFLPLGPDTVLNLVEKATGTRYTNLFRPMNSYINRVFELENEAGEKIIAKFYRPGRWSEQAILDEHRFLVQLAERELPVIAPLALKNGRTLGVDGRFCFCIFPKCGGRSVDEFTDEQWLELGRLIGRMHCVGEIDFAHHRPVMSPDQITSQQLEFLMKTRCVPKDLKPVLERAIRAIIGDIKDLFKNEKLIRIHGDCHFANLIQRPGESLVVIDFDDMAVGPPVQDVWMLLPGGLEDAFVELDLFLEGYETFRGFDRKSLRLVEPLRAMRFIHYMAWCAYQVEEDGLTRAIDGFGSHAYWQKEIEDLFDQRERIASGTFSGGNIL